MKMPEINFTVENAFNRLKKQCNIPSESEYVIKRVLQNMYDLGYTDGCSESVLVD
jgi:hypothetical protein